MKIFFLINSYSKLLWDFEAEKMTLCAKSFPLVPKSTNTEVVFWGLWPPKRLVTMRNDIADLVP